MNGRQVTATDDSSFLSFKIVSSLDSASSSLTVVASMKIGDAEVHDLEVVIHDLPEAPPVIKGLLRLNVLSHFSVTLDGGHNQLMLGRHP